VSAVTALKSNIRCFAGVCPACEQYLWTWTEQPSCRNGVPGVWLRCGECAAITYARPVRSHTIRRDPDWLVDSEAVVESFDEGSGDTESTGTTGLVTATDGGEP
jgi:hypothetical protein